MAIMVGMTKKDFAVFILVFLPLLFYLSGFAFLLRKKDTKKI